MSQRWIAVGAIEELPEGGTLRVLAGGEALCIYSVDGNVFVTQDECTHGLASLADGFIDGENIECPLHQGLFHIPTGRAVGVPCTEDLRTYPVKIENGLLMVLAELPEDP